MDVLVYVETRGSVPQSGALELLTAARTLAGPGGSVDAIVADAEPSLSAPLLTAADRIIAVAHPALAHYTPEAHLAVVQDIVEQRKPSAVLFTYSTSGLDLAPALALNLEYALVAYCTEVAVDAGGVAATSEMYGGKFRATSKATLPAVFMVMPGAFAEASETAGKVPEIINMAAPAKLDALRTTFSSEQSPAADAFDLTQASKIVSVGRGIGDKANVELATETATALGAEIAGSRPVTDNGWLPKERQVGKSGRKVKPRLYVALGISGAPEHLEGMRGADLIIAVNTDAAAPIFGVAHYGAVCDILDLLPELTARLTASGNV